MGLERKAVLRAAPARMGWARLLRRVLNFLCTDQLSAAFVSILAGQDVRDYVRRTFGVAVIGSNATEHRRLFEASMEFWSEAARIADFHPQ